jgi:hypothetical protein
MRQSMRQVATAFCRKKSLLSYGTRHLHPHSTDCKAMRHAFATSAIACKKLCDRNNVAVAKMRRDRLDCLIASTPSTPPKYEK